jgi:cbb3-type cytochrome oxidase subunit 3
MKIKRSIGLPAALLLYLIAIAIYAFPERMPQVTYTQWITTIVVTLVCIVVLYFVLKKREKFRENNRGKKM